MLNWTNDVPPGCLKIFHQLLKNEKINNILEIGCFHGTSIIGFLDLLPGSKAVCVDIWKNQDSELVDINFIQVEKQFDRNTLSYKDRIEKRKGDSKLVLHELIKEGRKFDLIYVDGSHTAFNVLHDSILSWVLLEKGGILIFDDYLWNKEGDKLDIPYYAINHFYKRMKGSMII